MKKFFKKLIYTLMLTLVFGYGVYTLIDQQKILNENNISINSLNSSMEQVDMDIEEKEETLAIINTEQYVEEVAREQLNYYKSSVRIYADSGR